MDKVPVLNLNFALRIFTNYPARKAKVEIACHFSLTHFYPHDKV
jgi:hypothetical protein